ETNRARFTWGQAHALEGFQLAHRPRDAGYQVMHVQLHHLGASARARIGHARAGDHTVSDWCLDRQVRIRKLGVAESEPKGEQRRIGLIQIRGPKRYVELQRALTSGRSPRVLVRVVDRDLAFGPRKGDREPPRWIHVSKENIRDSLTGTDARVPRQQERI